MTPATHSMSASVLTGTGTDDLRALADDWAELWSRHPERTPFGLPGWAVAWWRVFGAGRSLRCVIVRHGERPVALLPFALHEDRSLRLIGTPHADYGDIVGSPEQAPAALSVALDELARDDSWDRIICTNVRDDSVLAAGLRALPAAWAERLLSEPGLPAPAAVAGGDPDEMYGAFIGKKSLRQFTRKLASTVGELSLLHYEDRAEARRQLALMIRQHEERSALAGRESQFLRDPRERDLFLALIDELDPTTSLRYSVLWAGAHPVACHFGFEAAGRFVYFKPTFDVDYWELSAGQVLLVKIFEYARSRNVRVFDFSIGDEDYKYRFANDVPVTRNYTVSRTRAGAMVRNLAIGLRQAVRTRPRLHRLARRLARSTPPVVSSSSLTGSLAAFEARAEAPAPELRPARLSELARLSIRHPETFPAAVLDQFRIRLRRGETCVALREGNTIVGLGWRPSSSRPPVLGGRIGPVLYDVWIESGLGDGRLEGLVSVVGNGRPALVLAARGGAVAGAAVRLGWPCVGEVPLALLEPEPPST